MAFYFCKIKDDTFLQECVTLRISMTATIEIKWIIKQREIKHPKVPQNLKP